ncbi:hypothetical protein F5Y04DRAFT_62454 [Hypomontagnella monticulosa]|nr:hypothetical protein F5Y04DRAFT_62454 [Hypomontagnella monticulosa]
MKAELQSWWRSQTVHPSRLQPTVPICPCAACFNGTGHGQEVFRDPIDPGEVLPPRKNKAIIASIEKAKENEAKVNTVKKPWYKPASFLARKPSLSSMTSDLAPLCAASTSSGPQRASFDTRA